MRKTILPMGSVLVCILLMFGSFEYAISKPSLPDGRKSSDDIFTPGEICSTQACNETASMVLKNMDPSVDPCDNFYEFACGGYSTSARIPNGQPSTNVTYQIHQTIMKELGKSLEEPIQLNEPRPLKLVKTFYKSCMDTSTIETQSVDSLLEILKRIGGWPVIEGDNWNGDHFEWTKAINDLQKMGYLINNMPQVLVDVDIEIITQRSIYLILKPSLDQFAPLTDQETQHNIRGHMIDIAVELGANRKFAEKEFSELFNFVAKLHKLNVLNSGERFAYPMKMEKLSTLSETFPWQKYVENIIPLFSGISSNDEVIVVSPNSTESLNRLMNETSKRVQANFILWDVISLSVNSLKRDIREKYEKLLEEAKGRGHQYATRKDECIDKVSLGMPVGVSALYVRNHFDRNIKDSAIKIAKNIRERFNETLRAVAWPSLEMKRRFIQKFEKISFSIGYPDQFFNDSKLEELYRELNFTSPNNYLHNNLNLTSFILGESFANLRNKRDWKTYDMHSHYLYSLNWNTYYLLLMNSVVIPASSLRGVSNRRNNPQYIQYGTTGFLIAHEMLHAFDSLHRNFDEIGYRINWDDASKRIFNQTDICFMNQYTNYTVGGSKLNKPEYLNENFADNGGAKMAYLAYLNWSSKNAKPETQLPGLPYNPRQMFWISLTNNLCERRNDLHSYGTVDNHAPPQVRIIGTFSHIPEFAKDFNCPANSKMNLGNQCFIS